MFQSHSFTVVRPIFANTGFFLSYFPLSFFLSWKYILKLKAFNDKSQGLFAVWPKMLSEIQLAENIGRTIFTAIQSFSNWLSSSPSGSVSDHIELIFHLQLPTWPTLPSGGIAYLLISHLTIDNACYTWKHSPAAVYDTLFKFTNRLKVL